MSLNRVQVGDIVRRTSEWSHGNHHRGGTYRVTGLRAEGYSFISDGPLSRDGISFVYSAINYELVSRGPVEKKRSGFGKFISRIEK